MQDSNCQHDQIKQTSCTRIACYGKFWYFNVMNALHRWSHFSRMDVSLQVQIFHSDFTSIFRTFDQLLRVYNRVNSVNVSEGIVCSTQQVRKELRIHRTVFVVCGATGGEKSFQQTHFEFIESFLYENRLSLRKRLVIHKCTCFAQVKSIQTLYWSLGFHLKKRI